MKPNFTLERMFMSGPQYFNTAVVRSFFSKSLSLIVVLLFAKSSLIAQAPNNTCATAELVTVNATCVPTAGDLYNANATSPVGSCGGNRRDVWYRFTVPANTTFATISVSLASNPTTLTTSNVSIEMFNTRNCTINSTSMGCGNISAARTYIGLMPDSVYYFRVYTTTTPTVNPGQWNFNVCVTANDSVSNAYNIVAGTTRDAHLYGASQSVFTPVDCATGIADDDVWFKFTAVADHAIVTLSNIGANLSASGAMLQLFGGTPTALTTLACGKGIINQTSGLTAGNVYYVRVYSAGTGQAGFTQAGSSFKISVTPSAPVVVSSGRMKEMYHQTILSAVSTLDNPWEITYGPDGKLWITESKGYRLYRMDPVTGARDTVLDISLGSTFLALSDTPFNMQFNIGSTNPQGGFAGMALHPKFLDPVAPQNYVYVSYVHSFQINSDPNGIFYINRLVRFSYNESTGKLESPESLCDTLPGSNDHNSQRMIIAPVGSKKYLFYAEGDMGGGQFQNRLRPNKSQSLDSYEGKILRFNLEPEGVGDQWIPDDNPFNITLGVESAVWARGIRNNQGFAYDSVLNILYGSSHGPYSDDEINIIQEGKNYGHPLVIGYAADSNYDGSTAGAAFTASGGVSTCPPITDEHGMSILLGPEYKDPLFSAYAQPRSVINNIWMTNPGNGGWPSEGWSGLDLYTHTLVPGWKKSLIASSLKWGRLVRIRLGESGDTVISTAGQDTSSYFGSTNRFRDLAIAPGGKDLYVIMDKSATTSGPSAANPVIPACGGCVQKYTFLGYADGSGKSTIPTAIDVTAGLPDTCTPGTTVNINAANSSFWVPITGTDGNIMAEIYANGQILGNVTSSFYTHTGPIRNKGNARYLNRNITITPQFQPSSPVKVRFYFSKTEYDSLDIHPMSQVSSIADVKIHKNSDVCLNAISANTTLIDPIFSETHGGNGFMLQTDISGFSSFYFGAANLTLPVNLITFTGNYHNGSSYLKWETKDELNTDRFILERSVANNVFESIATVSAKGGPGKKSTYNYIDNKVANLGVPFVSYRLKITDKNGEYSYSNIVVINIPEILITMVNVFPNPASTAATLSIISPKDQKISWQLIDNAGRVILSKDQMIHKGNSRITVDLNNIPAGSYFIQVKGLYVNTIQKLQKL